MAADRGGRTSGSGRRQAGASPDRPAAPDSVDLRSDTVTRPDPAMRRAMADAEVGDDVLDGDPTTRRLEARVAELLGKERALFFPSGIMANQTALAVLGRPGKEVFLEAGSHILHYEEGAAAALSGLQLRPIPTPDGLLTAERVEAALQPASPFLPRTAALALENTHLGSGGRVMSLDVARALGALASGRGIRVHLDGARLWHAAAATGHPEESWAREADTVMVALSKGLGAPVGSLLAGDQPTMEEAWRVRRRFGGAMRQSGILAAAGLQALEGRARLVEDHEKARTLARGIDALEGVEVVDPETNIVMVDVVDDRVDLRNLLKFLATDGILMVEFGSRRVRAVTHRDIDEAGIARATAAFSRSLVRAREGKHLA